MALTSLDKDNVNRLMESLAITKINDEKYNEMKRYNTTTISKLQMIAEQIEYLQNSARNIMMQSELNKTLHEAECNFSKVMGHVYHFYERENGKIYCSLISPDEWIFFYKYYGSFLYDFDSEFKKL